jgi:VanZ family protein
MALASAGRVLWLLRALGDLLARVPRAPAALGACLWAGLIWWLSASSGPDVAPSLALGFLFNLAHAPLFGALALLLALALPRAAPRNWPRLTLPAALLVVAGVLAYGILDELHQAHTPGRVCTWRDVVTDAVGAGAVVSLAAYLSSERANGPGILARLAAWLVAACAAALLALYG